jgi:hypothetical protein
VTTSFISVDSNSSHDSHLDIHTQSNLADVEIISLVQELIPRYRLRAETDFACSNEDFIQTPRIDGSEFEALTNPQIRALLDYYGKYSNVIDSFSSTFEYVQQLIVEHS